MMESPLSLMIYLEWATSPIEVSDYCTDGVEGGVLMLADYTFGGLGLTGGIDHFFRLAVSPVPCDGESVI